MQKQTQNRTLTATELYTKRIRSMEKANLIVSPETNREVMRMAREEVAQRKEARRDTGKVQRAKAAWSILIKELGDRIKTNRYLLKKLEEKKLADGLSANDEAKLNYYKTFCDRMVEVMNTLKGYRSRRGRADVVGKLPKDVAIEAGLVENPNEDYTRLPLGSIWQDWVRPDVRQEILQAQNYVLSKRGTGFSGFNRIQSTALAKQHEATMLAWMGEAASLGDSNFERDVARMIGRALEFAADKAMRDRPLRESWKVYAYGWNEGN